MKKDDVIAVLQENAAEIHARGAKALYLFGSTARDQAGLESDIDLFLDKENPRRFSLITLVGLKFFLEGLLKTEVDLATREGLHPRLKERIEAEAVRIF
jgi:uncharacterized protein